MKSYRYLHLDVFTRRVLSGNQLAVYLDGADVPADAMQAIAREMNFAETVFVLPPGRPECDARLRIFTPNEELPMAGHPTVGSAFALAHAGRVLPAQRRIVFDLIVGPTAVALDWKDGKLAFAWMTQRPPEFGTIANSALAASALSLSTDAVVGTGLPVQVVSCGVPFLFVPIASREAVDAARLDAAAYSACCRNAGIDELPVFLFTTATRADTAGATAYSRMFAPGLGIGEDPATGGASGPLGCYLVRHNAVSSDQAGKMLSRQGVKMQRPSEIHIAIGLQGDHAAAGNAASGQAISSVQVGGEAIVAGEGILYL
ncbi:MAG TPA: PhzF family phenazine biosynthesis protein [Vicinamibacterales bacterium]|nr:PhzF family phenazine biosynthesis protein [Vicinamibacterales bacterium]